MRYQPHRLLILVTALAVGSAAIARKDLEIWNAGEIVSKETKLLLPKGERGNLGFSHNSMPMITVRLVPSWVGNAEVPAIIVNAGNNIVALSTNEPLVPVLRGKQNILCAFASTSGKEILKISNQKNGVKCLEDFDNDGFFESFFVSSLNSKSFIRKSYSKKLLPLVTAIQVSESKAQYDYGVELTYKLNRMDRSDSTSISISKSFVGIDGGSFFEIAGPIAISSGSNLVLKFEGLSVRMFAHDDGNIHAEILSYRSGYPLKLTYENNAGAAVFRANPI